MATPTYMETNDASLVRLIKNGAIFARKVADNPAPPTGTAWTPGGSAGKLGYYSEDGFTLSPQPGDETTIAAHNGDDVISEQAPGHWTIAFSGLEANETNAEAYFDVEVAGDGSVTVTTAAANTRYDLVIVGLDQRDQVILVHLPNVQINAREDLVFNRTTLLAYGMTFRTFKGGANAPYHFKAWGVTPATAITPAAPTLTSATPSAVAAGGLVTITGRGFNGATGAAAVKFGATNAAAYTVHNDTLIVASVPAGSAGAANITVTNVTGTSTALPYTRGA